MCRIGVRTKVPFGNKQATALVVAVELLDLLASTPGRPLRNAQLQQRCVRWALSRTYCCTYDAGARRSDIATVPLSTCSSAVRNGMEYQ